MTTATPTVIRATVLETCEGERHLFVVITVSTVHGLTAFSHHYVRRAHTADQLLLDASGGVFTGNDCEVRAIADYHDRIDKLLAADLVVMRTLRAVTAEGGRS